MQRPIVMQLQSVRFTGDGTAGGDPIPLRDPDTDLELRGQPEWIKGERAAPAAYVRGHTPAVEIGLQVGWFAPGEFQLSAWGEPPPTAAGRGRVQVLGPHPVTVSQRDRRRRFVSAGIVPFKLPLPDRIGRHTFHLDWYADWEEGGIQRRLFLGHTPLELLTTWKPMASDPELGLHPWAYDRVMQWSCAWASGADEPSQICDRLMENLAASGLQYGVPNWDVRAMLVDGGGMCGGWYQLFAQLANCQGVPLSLQTLKLPATSDAMWTGLVLTAPGVNQVSPSFIAGVQGHYHDSEGWPAPPRKSLPVKGTRRYFFPPDPDGHCVNMLDHGDGTVTVYDPSFQLVARRVKMRLPPREGRVERFTSDASFRALYFDTAVPFLMGELPPDARPLTLGVTVRTQAIPELDLVWNHVPLQTLTRQSALERLRLAVATYVTDPDEAASWEDRLRRLDKGPAQTAGPITTALTEAKALPPRRDGPMPHAMPASEILQHALLELLHAEGKAAEARKTIARLHEEAVSPLLRTLAKRLL